MFWIELEEEPETMLPPPARKEHALSDSMPIKFQFNKSKKEKYLAQSNIGLFNNKNKKD